MKNNKGLSLFSVLLFIVFVAVIAGVFYLIMHGLGKGIGNGAGDNEGDGNTTISTTQESAAFEENDKIIEKDLEGEENSLDNFEGAVIQINVVENEYFYENERITLDDFVNKTKQIDGDFVVEVKDDNASLNAYNDLIDRLEKEAVRYVEK